MLNFWYWNVLTEFFNFWTYQGIDLVTQFLQGVIFQLRVYRKKNTFTSPLFVKVKIYLIKSLSFTLFFYKNTLIVLGLWFEVFLPYF